MDIFWLILIGMTVGLLAGYFMNGKGFGTIGDLIAGVIGALVGGAIFTGRDIIGSLLVATIGAIVFLYGVRMVKKV